MVTASGRISATTWPSGTSFYTSGSVQPADVYLAATDLAGQPVGQADELGHERGRRSRVCLSGRCELLQPASVLVTDEEVTRCTSSPAAADAASIGQDHSSTKVNSSAANEVEKITPAFGVLRLIAYNSGCKTSSRSSCCTRSRIQIIVGTSITSVTTLVMTASSRVTSIALGNEGMPVFW
jgi:hypothetical protein